MIVIGLDIGTTNTKAVAMDSDDRVVAAASTGNRTLAPAPEWSVQQPGKILSGIQQCLSEVVSQIPDKRQIACIAVSSAMHSLLPLDKRQRPLCPVMLWSDNRAATLVHHLAGDPDFADFTRRTGVPFHPMAPVFKIMWLRENASDIFNKTHSFSDIKAFFFLWATGLHVVDISVASASGLLVTHNCQWSEKYLNKAGVRTEQLPRPVDPYFLAELKTDLAHTIGLTAPIPVVVGASDGALANLGADPDKTGALVLTVGTSAAIRRFINGDAPPESDKVFTYRLDHDWCVRGGASNNGANTLEWLRRHLLRSRSNSADMIAAAAAAPAGSDGLVFLPYLLGERAPVWNPDMRAGFWGIHARHRQPHFVRAVLEGVLLNMRMVDMDMSGETIYATGGFTRSALWLQILADIFDKKVLVSEMPVDASVYGAILTGRKALNISRPSEPAAARFFLPDRQNTAVYRSVRERFGEILAKAIELV